MIDEQDTSQDIRERIIGVFHAYKIPILLGGLSIFVIFVSLIFLVKSTQTTTPIQFSSNAQGATDSTNSSSSAKLQKMIHVDVEGGVERPGVYGLPLGSRVDDAIRIAGGISSEVDADGLAKQLNRASVLVDGGKIYVPKKGEVQGVVNSMSYNNSSQNGSMININLASQTELDSLPGVGPVIANKIISARPYNTLDDLVNKKVISASLFKKIKSRLTL